MRYARQSVYAWSNSPDCSERTDVSVLKDASSWLDIPKFDDVCIAFVIRLIFTTVHARLVFRPYTASTLNVIIYAFHFSKDNFVRLHV